jgi:hypothetical protein
MIRKSLTIWLFIVYILLLSILAWVGSPILATIFLVLLVFQVAVHAIWICPRCGNYSCAINPKSPHFFLGAPKPEEPLEERPPINTTLPILLMGIMFLIALYAVLLVSLRIAAIMAFAGIILYYVYSQDACRACVNKCVMARKSVPATADQVLNERLGSRADHNE